MSTVTRPLPAAPPRNTNGMPATRQAPVAKTFNRSRGVRAAALGVLIYGTGGIGKSSLAAMAKNVLVLDLERSTNKLDVERIDNIESWSELLACVRSIDTAGVDSIVIDSATAAEEMCRKWVIENVKTEKGSAVTSIEGYGWGKGFTHIAEEWRKLLSELDRHRIAGRDVIFVAHERIGNVPNPAGEDYIRYEPRLMHKKDASTLAPTKEWCDEVVFVSYDVAASDGKAKGSGTRTIYTIETATHMAKTRTLDGTPIVFNKDDDTFWRLLKGTPASSGESIPE